MIYFYTCLFGYFCQKFSLKVLLSICLLFCHFQPGVAFKKNEVFSKYWHEIVRNKATCFLGIRSLVFLNFGMILETHVKLCVTDGVFFWKIGKWGNGPKLEEYKVFWIYWKICPLICYKFVLTWKFTLFANAPVQILYLRKICFLRYGPKLSDPIKLQDF